MGFSSKRVEKTFSWSLANLTRVSSDPNFTLSRSELLANQKRRKLPGLVQQDGGQCVDEWLKESGFDEEIVSTLNVEYIYV